MADQDKAQDEKKDFILNFGPPAPVDPPVSRTFSGTKVKLASADGKEFDVPVEAAKLSITIKNMLEDLGDADTSIPLPNVQSTVLEKVIEYCTWHYEHWVNPPEVREGEIERKSTDDIIPWDEAFLKVSQTTLYDLILAANFLDIKPLLDVTCKIVARGIKACQDAEDIRKYLGVKNDYTPEEEATVRKENEWIETGRLNI